MKDKLELIKEIVECRLNREDWDMEYVYEELEEILKIINEGE